MAPIPALAPSYGQLFGEILSVPGISRNEVYRQAMNYLGRQLATLVNEIFAAFPTIIDDAGRQSAWNELVDKSRELMRYYVEFYRENLNAPMPTRDSMLTELSSGPNKVSDVGLKVAIDSLRGIRSGTTFQGPSLTLPHTLEEVPAREAEAPAQEEAPAPRPARRYAAPTIAELATEREGRYTNIIDANIAGKIFRFASNDPSLDVIGMTPEQLLQYALDNPGKIRIFEVNARGYATRELHTDSERDLNRLRAQIEAQKSESEA